MSFHAWVTSQRYIIVVLTYIRARVMSTIPNQKANMYFPILTRVKDIRRVQMLDRSSGASQRIKVVLNIDL